MCFHNDKVVSRILRIVVKKKCTSLHFFCLTIMRLFFCKFCFSVTQLWLWKFLLTKKQKESVGNITCHAHHLTIRLQSRVLWPFQKRQLFQSFCHRRILEPTQYIFHTRIPLTNTKLTAYPIREYEPAYP